VDFLLCFMRDVFVFLNSKESAMGSFLCILFVYLILLSLSLKDFRNLKFNFNDSASILILVLSIGTICYSVLNLKLERLDFSFSLYVVFGIVLSLLSIVVLLNYIKNESYIFVNAMMMCVCFIITDIFFVLYNFYFNLYIFSLISIITQVLSYFFMVKYFIAKDQIKIDLDNNRFSIS
jgi:predicted Kef-type K+ transport protein